MTKAKDEPAVSFEVGPDGASAQVSDKTLSHFGRAAAWLFPKKDAKSKITAALAERVAEKIRSGAPLDDSERYFVGRMFDREARMLANAEQVAERTQFMLPEVQRRLGPLPDADSPVGSSSFVSRAESVAAEISEDDIRDLFARVLAGEISKPGSFSLRTLEVIRTLDPNSAKVLTALCNFVVDGAAILRLHSPKKYWARLGIDAYAILELEEAGILTTTTLTIQPEQVVTIAYGQKSIRLTGKKKRQVAIPEDAWFSALRLTRVGRELSAVLPFKEDDEYFQIVISDMAAELAPTGKVEFRDNDSAEWRPAIGETNVPSNSPLQRT